MQPSVNIAIRAMRQAREHLIMNLHQYDILTPESPQYADAVQYMHKDAYKILFDAIKKAFPTHFFTDSVDAPAEKEDSWHFLGIHSPENLMRKDSASAISLLHRHKGKVQDAIVMNILSGDEYTASRGKGTALNDRRARCTAFPKPDVCIYATSAPSLSQNSRDKGLDLLQKLGSVARDVRVTGCTVLDLAMLASGQRDAVVTLEPSFSELEAALLICHEAGVLTAQIDGAPFVSKSTSIVAANPKLLKASIQALHTI